MAESPPEVGWGVGDGWTPDADALAVVHGTHANRAGDVYYAARNALRHLMCLGTTKSGQPRHPLYVAGETPLQEWPRV